MIRFKIKENLIVIIFLILIFGMFIDYSLNLADSLINTDTVVEKTEYKEEFLEIKKELTTIAPEKPLVEQDDSLVHRLVKSYKTKTNTISNYNDIFFKDFFLNLNARLCRNIGISYIPGTTFLKHEDGTLITCGNDGDFKKDKMNLHVGFLSNFMQKLDKKEINYLYVSCPNKELLMNDLLPFGFNNNQLRDEKQYMINVFQKNNIPILDLTEDIIKNYELSEIFYKTDHHWKTEYGIISAKSICEYLNSEYSYEIDESIFDMSNYDIEKYEKCLLGSTGINSTGAFVDSEDFNVYIPKEKNEFSFEIPSKNIDLKGNFNIFINREKLDNREQWPFNAYASYMYANSAYLKIENKTINNEHKVLVVKDSFANAIVPYLAQAVKRIDVIDLRKTQTDHFNDNIMKFIEENNYDMILFVFSKFSYEYDRLFLK